MALLNEVYLGLGGNIGDSVALLNSALTQIQALPGAYHLQCSSFYSTKPVSDLPQRKYVNAVCCFETELSPWQLLAALQKIESGLGKRAKPKNAPRPIDLDILLFGKQFCDSAELQIPHPAWQARLFVLIPLAELREWITYPSSPSVLQRVRVHSLIEAFSKAEQESMVQLINPLA